MFYCVINKEGVSVTFDTPSCCCKINNPSVYEDISQNAPILIPFIMYSTNVPVVHRTQFYAVIAGLLIRLCTVGQF